MTFSHHYKPCTFSAGWLIDIYEDGRYIYKGANPNNYITFNDEKWRILSLEKDGTIKIIRNEILSSMNAWDTSNSCPVTYNTSEHNGIFTVPNIIYLAPGGGASGCNQWTRPATLNTYLNDVYYNNIDIMSKSKIVSHTWNIGAITENNHDLDKQVKDENAVQWVGNIGLITASEYVRANTNVEQCGNLYDLYFNNNVICYVTNWMYISSTSWWTISPVDSNSHQVISVFRSDYLGAIETIYSQNYIRPVLYLSPDITLSGSGSKEEPYIIVN